MFENNENIVIDDLDEEVIPMCDTSHTDVVFTAPIAAVAVVIAVVEV